MQTSQDHSVRSALYRLAGILEDLAAGCEPEFDMLYDDLEREFAELRCQIGNG